MKNVKISELPEMKEHPVLEGLPDELKDFEKFKSVEERLRRVMVSDHKHTSAKAFAKCKRCKAKFDKRRSVLKEYGFKSYHQYLIWRRVMDIMTTKKGIKI